MAKTLAGRVKWHFLSRGYHEVRHKGSDRELLFKEGLNLTLVRLVTRDELRDRNALLKAIVSLNPRDAKVNRAYLALPKRYVAALDGSILKDRGIGVIAYDEGSVQEVVPAVLFEREPESQHVDETETLRYDVDELRRLYTELRKEVMDLRVELTDLRRELRGLRTEEQTTVAVEERKERSRAAGKAPGTQGSELPSFFADNPWLDVLSRRGREDDTGGRSDK